MRRRFLEAAIGLVLVVLVFAANASAQSNVALVIGNGTYQTAPSIKTATGDAAIVAETLRAAGYDVIELDNVRQADIGQAMRGFLDKAAASGPEGVALFYYAGHAAQFEGENYLVPVDAVINSGTDLANEAFRLKDLLAELAMLPLAARIVVLEAARDHKFGATGNQPVPKGLLKFDAAPGTLVAFAAAPDSVALDDGEEPYSLYTQTLVALMRQPDLKMGDVFKSAQRDVSETTESRQAPWLAGSVPTELVLFGVPAPAPVPAPQAATPPQQPSSDQTDLAKVSCAKFIASNQTEIATILTWLDGYYKGPDEPPVFDAKQFLANSKRLAEYCVANPKAGLIAASDRVFGSRNQKGRP